MTEKVRAIDVELGSEGSDILNDGGGFGFGFAGFHDGGVAPEVFEVVEFADVAAHDVDDDIEVIEDDPGGVDGAIRAAGGQLVIFFEVLLDFVDDGAEVRLARAGANDEVIGNAGDFAEVEDDDVFCLFVVREFPAEHSQFSGVHSFIYLNLRCLNFRKDKGHCG
jgi:hypothetical protein